MIFLVNSNPFMTEVINKKRLAFFKSVFPVAYINWSIWVAMNTKAISVIISKLSNIIIQQLLLNREAWLIHVLPKSLYLILEPISTITLLFLLPNHFSFAMLLVVHKFAYIMTICFGKFEITKSLFSPLDKVSLILPIVFLY